MPTENRSSNTEMVSVPPFIGLEPLVGRFYPARCRRCGWVGSSEELTEDDAQCTRDVGDRLCLGDCDELECDDLLRIIQAMSMPAQQHQGEPVARYSMDQTGCEELNPDDPWVRFDDLKRADAGEVERLRLKIEQLRFSLEAHNHESVQDNCARAENRTLNVEVERLRSMERSHDLREALLAQVKGERDRMIDRTMELAAELAERDQLLGSAKSALCHLLHNIKISGKRIELGLAKDSADTVITLINALQAEAKS